jgi:hypothetical protein
MIRHALVAAALVAVAPAARAQMVDQARCYAAAERLMEKQNGHPLTQSERAGLQTYLFRLLLAGQSPTAIGADYDDIRRFRYRIPALYSQECHGSPTPRCHAATVVSAKKRKLARPAQRRPS